MVEDFLAATLEFAIDRIRKPKSRVGKVLYWVGAGVFWAVGILLIVGAILLLARSEWSINTECVMKGLGGALMIAILATATWLLRRHESASKGEKKAGGQCGGGE